MKRTLLCLLTAALVANLAGCFRAHSTTDINADGSGIATLEFSLSQAVAAAITEMQELNPEAGGDMEMPSIATIKRDKIEKAIKPFDVKLTAFESKTADGRETVSMTFAFADLKGLSAAMAAAMDQSPEEGMGIYETGDGNYVLKSATYDFSDYPEFEDEKAAEDVQTEAPAEQTPEQMQKQMQVMGTLMGAMAELDVSLKITVPGDIIESNAPTREGRTSIWTINSTNMMTAGPDMEPVITFSGKGLKIKNALKQ